MPLAPRGATLSVIVGASRPGPFVAACLESLRTVADEIIIGAAERVSEFDLAWYGSVADKVVTYPFLTMEQQRGWLRTLCSGDWILIFDDDEIPSEYLLQALPALLNDPMIGAYSLPRWAKCEGIRIDGVLLTSRGNVVGTLFPCPAQLDDRWTDGSRDVG